MGVREEGVEVPLRRLMVEQEWEEGKRWLVQKVWMQDWKEDTEEESAERETDRTEEGGRGNELTDRTLYSQTSYQTLLATLRKAYISPLLLSSEHLPLPPNLVLLLYTFLAAQVSIHRVVRILADGRSYRK